MATGKVNTGGYSAISNSPLYNMSHNVVFTAPSDGYVRVNGVGVLRFYNTADGTYPPLIINRYASGSNISQSIYVNKGQVLKWEADDASTAIQFWRCV